MNKRPTEALAKYRDQLEAVKDGTVTAIKSQRDPNRCSIYIDGEFVFGLSLSILGKSEVAMGKNLSCEVQRNLISQDFRVKARVLAFNYVGYQPRSRKQLITRLQRYTGNADFVDGIVDEMEKLGHIDDSEFAFRFVEARHRLKGHGPSRLRSDLFRKGVDKETIALALTQLEENSLDQRAEEILRVRWRVYSKLEHKEKRRNRAMGFLLRRGYSYSTANAVFAKLENESGDRA